MNRLLHIVLFALFAAAPCMGSGTDPVDEKPGLSYLRAKQHAETHQMKYVLYFKADWCAPCQWIEESTLSDETVKASMDQMFVMVPLDIDEFEGYALKEYFQVYSLPTFLVFNHTHELVNRKEGSISASGFLDMVANDRVIQQAENAKEQPLVTLNAKPAPNASAHSRPSSQLSDTPTSSAPEAVFNAVSKYGVQLGAFSSFENAKAVQDRARQFTSESVDITTITNSNNIIIYKVFAGRLDTEDQARQLQHTLSKYGIDGFVKAVAASVKS